MPNQLRRAILDRHEQSLQGALRDHRIFSKHLCHSKHLYIYEPDGMSTMQNVPVVYLFRGHEREWVHFNEDSSRQATTAIEDIDILIQRGILPPVILVMPGLNSANNHIPSLGINMKGQWPRMQKGLGTGRFWSYLTREVFPLIEKKYPVTKKSQRLAAGFSLGGFTVSLLGIHLPGYFHHLGVYDGLFMWQKYQDPRVTPDAPYNDRVWLKNPLFDAAFGKPRKRPALSRWNPTNTLVNANASLLDKLRISQWWIASAASDGTSGNLDRTTYFIDLLKRHNLPNGFDFVVFDQNASHNWHWTDRFLIRFLQETLL